MAEHVAVLGAGVVGAATALALQRDGHRVTLIDRSEPGMGASFGNAGFIHTGGNIPLAAQGIVRAALRMIFDEEAPLVIRWRHFPAMAPWLWRFVRRSRPDAFMADARALNELTSRAVPAWQALAAETRAQDLFGARGELYLFRHREKFEATRAEFDLRRELGVDVQEMGADDIRQMEPGVTREAQHGWYLADSMYVKSPHRLTCHLAEAAVANGAALLRMDARGISLTESGVRVTAADGAEFDADRLVIATGAHSKRFARQVGASVPLRTLRGYHVMLPGDAAALGGPVIDAEKKIGVVPMNEGIRVAGMIEMASERAPPNDARANVLLKLARGLVPEIPDRLDSRWLGHRPGIPDSRPVIGRSPRSDRVLFAFGHGTIGLTLGAITGQIVADLVAGREPPVDLSLFAPTRF